MIHLFDKNENTIGRLSTQDLLSAVQTEPINGIVQLDFSVKYGSMEKMKDVDYVAHNDVVNPNEIQMYKVISAVPSEAGGYDYKAIHVIHDELNGYGYVRQRILGSVQASQALGVALGGTRWQVGYADVTPPGSLSFYDNSRGECLSKILETWNVELAYRLRFDGNNIVARYVDMYTKRGKDRGQRYALGTGALTVVKEVSQSGLYTAAVGRGKGEEKTSEDGTATGGYGRKIQFTDVEWSKAKGDPVDKPKGQEYVEIPEMTALYGYSDGSARYKVCVYSDIEDPVELLKKTYEDLLVNSRPLVQLKATIKENSQLELGDTVTIVRKDLGIYYKTRVFSVKRDILSGGLVEINLGDKLVSSQSEFYKSIRNEIKATQSNMEASLGSIVEDMQGAIVKSMYDDESYSYDLRSGNKWKFPSGKYYFDRPIDNNPTKAIYFGGGKFAIANSKDAQGNWNWKTFGTGDGFVADMITTGTLTANLIKAGVLTSKNGRVSINLENGAINFDDDLTYDPGTRRLKIGGTAQIDSAVIPDLSADKIKSGTIDADYINVRNLHAGNITSGTLDRPYSYGDLTNGDTTRIDGASMAFGSNSNYIKIRDTGGRGEITVDGTVAVEGSTYFYEMNAGGIYGGSHKGSASVMIAQSGSGTALYDNNASQILRVYNGSLYYQGRKLTLTATHGVRWD